MVILSILNSSALASFILDIIYIQPKLTGQNKILSLAYGDSGSLLFTLSNKYSLSMSCAQATKLGLWDEVQWYTKQT